jgi:hypothetical protein
MEIKTELADFFIQILILFLTICKIAKLTSGNMSKIVKNQPAGEMTGKIWILFAKLQDILNMEQY